MGVWLHFRNKTRVNINIAFSKIHLKMQKSNYMLWVGLQWCTFSFACLCSDFSIMNMNYLSEKQQQKAHPENKHNWQCEHVGQAFLGVRDTQGRDLGVGKSILALRNTNNTNNTNTNDNDDNNNKQNSAYGNEPQKGRQDLGAVLAAPLLPEDYPFCFLLAVISSSVL